jgi:hypothetical protein
MLGVQWVCLGRHIVLADEGHGFLMRTLLQAALIGSLAVIAVILWDRIVDGWASLVGNPEPFDPQNCADYLNAEHGTDYTVEEINDLFQKMVIRVQFEEKMNKYLEDLPGRV